MARAVRHPETENAATDAAQARSEHGSGDSAAAPVLPDELLPGAVEAVLLTMDKPVSAAKLAAALGSEGALPESRIEPLVEQLNADYEATKRSFRIEKVAGGYRIMTLPDFAPAVAAAHGLQSSTRLSRAAVETLAIVAYRQPITRASVEAIRGVACGEVLRTLLEKKLVTITGRAEELGRPMLYGTTQRFLEAFGLASLRDLPRVGDLFPGLDDDAIEQAAGPRPLVSDKPSETDDPADDSQPQPDADSDGSPEAESADAADPLGSPDSSDPADPTDEETLR